MATLPQFTSLPADLPVDWQQNQIVSPNGTEVGLSGQHGYNYLNGAVNSAQSGVNTLQTSVTQINQEVENNTQEINSINEEISGIDQSITNINQALGKVAPEIYSYTIVLQATGWAENSTSEAALTGMYLQQITATTFTPAQRVDIAIPPSTMLNIPAGITTANVNGTVYAVTEYPPSFDVDAQITILTVTEVS